MTGFDSGEVMKKLVFKDLLGKRLLICGEVGTGKTRITVRLLEEAVELGFSKDITVIDMAPMNAVVRGIRVGGRLSEATSATKLVRYLTPRRVETPRLAAEDGDSLLFLVAKNRRRVGRLLRVFLEAPTSILFMNDTSIYLQSGDFNALAAVVGKASTVIANGYYGRTLSSDFSTGISTIERELMDRLASIMDTRIILA